MRLNCRTAENLIVTDDVLASLNTNWNTLQIQIEGWLRNYPNHQQSPDMGRFRESGYDRRDADLKSLRNVLMMLAGSLKPWEVAVGQAIAGILTKGPMTAEHSLTAYLGPKLVTALNLKRRSRYT